MKYDLFLSDFDGTLVLGDSKISETNIAAIRGYRAQGGIFAVVTGRMLSSVLPRLRELGLKEGLVVAYQGGMIADIASGKLLKHDYLSSKIAASAVKMLEEEALHIHVYEGDTLYCNTDDEYLRIYEQLCGVKAVVTKELLSEKILREGMKVDKILVMLSPEEREALIEELRSKLGAEYGVTTSSEYLVEILPAGVSKANAVAYLSEYYKIPRERTAAIGDQLNDLPMLEAAGGSFAVANAAEELKNRATVVAAADRDGVAEAIRHYAMDPTEQSL